MGLALMNSKNYFNTPSTPACVSKLTTFPAFLLFFELRGCPSCPLTQSAEILHRAWISAGIYLLHRYEYVLPDFGPSGYDMHLNAGT